MKTASHTTFDDTETVPVDAPCPRSSFRVAAAPRKSSRTRRIEQLRVLVAELMVRDLGCAAAAALLGCSVSAARAYLHELRAAGVLAASRIRQPARSVDKMAFRLHPDTLLVHAFLDTLADAQHCDVISTKRGGHKVDARTNVRHFHIMRDDCHISLKVSSAPAQRDPLVAALFGAPCLAKQGAAMQIE